MIYVCDAVMGSGKSSAAIYHMNHSSGRYIYCTPYLSEVKRIIDACPDRDFREPEVKSNRSTKLRGARYLLHEGFNVSTTHALMGGFDPEVTALIRRGEYTMIIDEASEVIKEAGLRTCDIEDAEKLGVVEIVDGVVHWVKEDYDGLAFQPLKRMLDTKSILRTVDGQFYTLLYCPDVLRAAKDVYVLTYLFPGSLMECFFKIFRLEYKVIGVRNLGDHYEFCDGPAEVPGYVKHIRDVVNVYEPQPGSDVRRWNDIGRRRTALSVGWFRSHPKEVDVLRKHTIRYLADYCGVPADKRMWTTFKECFDDVCSGGMKRAFVSLGTRATNEFADRTALAFLANVYMNPYLYNSLCKMGAPPDKDVYALSSLVQWVWRSAVRRGEEINIYIPSSRMRKLFTLWLDGLAE